MSDRAILLQQVLAWSNSLMAVRSLDQLAARLAQPPAADGESLTGVLLLLDPRHELRRLAAGEGKQPDSRPGLRFIDSLAGVAPGYGTLHAPWSGPYHPADHGLLIAAEAGCTHLTLLPLPRSGGLTGVYNVGSRDGPAALAALEPAWLDHIGAQALASAERQLQRARLLCAGVVDPLTGWNSRHYFLSRMREQLAASVRDSVPATCLLIDVDGLGSLNERRGVAAGDAVLFEVGSIIEAQARASDSFAHLGDDEFAVLLPATPPQFATRLAERILAAVRAAPIVTTPGKLEEVRVSVGIAGLDPAALVAGMDRKATADEWLSRAYAALHQAKRAGGDRCVAS
ncbi:MAG: GGDEF domain-containing protein [Steroidobacteraceae bacterium]|jgi:diguanylate cyclase (GGDEF)-like protein|nr:GGDEF domain-containing protein [Pseudomonadota bacterium]MBP7609257.1 GGDEF domain-containing protein [Steroidobacteraceae bacterium]MBP9129428.1 GGDEF domain-containing protein [Steroidobacteraceae bacterium]